jgi:hypothetical protein
VTARRGVAVAAIVALVSLLGALAGARPVDAATSAEQPTVSGPVHGGKGTPFVASTTIDLRPFGYRGQEYFVSGNAPSYTSAGPLAEDGRWTATPGPSAPYTTRIVVRRPARAKDFNGTVVVEWLNVTAGLDAAPDWTYLHTTLMREGYAWVGVSAQQVGVEGPGLGIAGGQGGGPLKLYDQARYATLNHPGDGYSYGIFTQVAQLLRHPGPVKVLGPLHPRRLIAVGESQSAIRLTTYINAIQPIAHAYNGFLVHSRAGGAAPVGANEVTPTVVQTRSDTDVPVLTFQTETDLVGLGYAKATQPDSRHFRLWETAGTAHADLYQLSVGATDTGHVAKDTSYLPPTSTAAGGFITCATPVNQGPEQFLVGAAFTKLDRWVRGGAPAPHAARLQIDATGAIVRDEHGNAVGGIRSAAVDAPIAALSGSGQTGSAFCGLFGTTVKFDAATLKTLYPTHGAYVRAVDRATARAVHAGFVQPADAVSIHHAAQHAKIRS